MIAPGIILDGGYRVDELLGEGSFGVVYRGQDLNLDRRVAVKFLKTGSDPEGSARGLVAEGRRLANLSHPNVVQVYHLGYFETSPYVVMEFLDGPTLGHLARRDRRTLREHLAIMRQVASGLAAVHAAGILHHDLSPNNVALTASGTAKLLDFGLAKDSRDVTTLRTRSRLAGTLLYVAPEQIEGRGITGSSEVFSFGVLLHEVLTGENPFAAEHVASVLSNILHRAPAPIEERIENCPPALAALVAQCLEKEPQARPRDMADVEARLAAMLAGGEVDQARTTTLELSPILRSEGGGNPYLSRVMIKSKEAFFGRRQEVQRIFARLNATPPGSISIVGDRKIGKSSLLNHIYMMQQRRRYLEHPEKTVMVFLDLQQEKGMTTQVFVRSLLTIAGLELRHQLQVSDISHDLEGIKHLVERIDHAGFRLAVLLDEFDTVTTNPNFDVEFFSFLRFLANHYNVAYLTSSARNLQVLCHTREIADSPFFNIFSTMRLAAFGEEEARELIRVPSERAGRPLQEYAEQILRLSGLFPFFIQMACCHAFEFLEEHPGHSPDFEEIHKRYRQEAQLHYRYLWDSFDMHEQDAIRRIAAGRRIPDSLRHVVEELQVRTYVRSTGSRPTLFAETFTDFIRSLEGVSGSTTWISRLLRRPSSR